MLYDLLTTLYKCLANFPYCISTDLSSSIKIAIRNNDTNGLDYIITTKIDNEKNKQTLKHLSKDFLPDCYYYYNLLFAEKLIKAGAEFKSYYIIYTILSTTTYKIQ